MLDFLFRKLLPFALARSMSIAAIPLFQFLLVAFCGREEAGRFYLLTSLAFIASQVADLGISRAMPIIYGESDEKMHACLAEINLLRWLAGLVAGAFFLICSHFGEVSWSWNSGGLALFLFCVGRVVLLGNQGYCHARQQYRTLLRGSLIHFLSIVALYSFYELSGRFEAGAAIICLTLGVWVELLVLDRPATRSVRKKHYNWSEALRFVAPFAKVGLYTAIYNRIESVVAGSMLDESTLGIFGTLDSAFRLGTWPSYVSSQALFPGIRDAVEGGDYPALLRHSLRYFAFSASVCALLAVLSLVTWIYHGTLVSPLVLAVILLWFAMWLAVPYAFMAPLFYSLKLEETYSKITFRIMLLRCSLAPILAYLWGYVGLCAIHLIVALAAVAALWQGCRLQLRKAFQVENACNNSTEQV